MNSEQIKTDAANAIALFNKTHTTTAYLYWKDGQVVVLDSQHAPLKVPEALKITPWQQDNGLTASQWTSVGNELFNLYTRELACQAHQKP